MPAEVERPGEGGGVALTRALRDRAADGGSWGSAAGRRGRRGRGGDHRWRPGSGGRPAGRSRGCAGRARLGRGRAGGGGRGTGAGRTTPASPSRPAAARAIRTMSGSGSAKPRSGDQRAAKGRAAGGAVRSRSASRGRSRASRRPRRRRGGRGAPGAVRSVRAAAAPSSWSSGRSPRTTPPGSRTDPAPSLPVAIGTSPAATAAAEPAEEPPGVRSARQGLTVRPWAPSPQVCQGVPGPGTEVAPTGTHPAARSGAAPRSPCRPFTPSGTPASGGRSPASTRRSTSRARRSASSSHTSANAHSCGIHPPDPLQGGGDDVDGSQRARTYR